MLDYRGNVTAVAGLFGFSNDPELEEEKLTINGLTFTGSGMTDWFVPGTNGNKGSRLLFMLLAVNIEDQDQPFSTIPVTADQVRAIIEHYYAERWPPLNPPQPQPLLDALRDTRYTHVKIHWKGHGH